MTEDVKMTEESVLEKQTKSEVERQHSRETAQPYHGFKLKSQLLTLQKPPAHIYLSI